MASVLALLESLCRGFILFFNFWFLIFLGGALHGVWDLSSLTRGWTWAPSSGSPGFIFNIKYNFNIILFYLFVLFLRLEILLFFQFWYAQQQIEQTQGITPAIFLPFHFLWRTLWPGPGFQVTLEPSPWAAWPHPWPQQRCFRSFPTDCCVHCALTETTF